MMITEDYQEHEVVYMETENKWRTVINGRERSFESLVKARESIDRSLHTLGKSKKFEPIDAYLGTYEEYQKVKVTSIAEDVSWNGSKQVWINRNGDRRKESSSNLYQVSKENITLMQEIANLRSEVKAKEIEIEQKKNLLKPIELPAE